MNPYERRIIHSALQYDKYVETHSEGDEPYRRVVITLKKGYREYSGNRAGQSKPAYNRNYSKPYSNRSYKKETSSETTSVE
jgi:spoIIIJ-associated protein